MDLSPIAIDHVRRPRRRGPIEDAIYGVSGSPGGGPYVEIWVKVDSGIVRQAAFRTPGCPSSTAAASVLCELAEGRETSRVASLTGEDLLAVLGGLPEGKGFYAAMSVEAMSRAIETAEL